MCFAFIAGAIAQHQVTGTVTDTNGEGGPGASIVQRGTTNGTITKADGSYLINVPNDATIVYSFVGMSTVEESVNGRSTINVVMTSEDVGLEAIVVTAMGIKRDSRALGYTISRVEGVELVKAGVTSNPLTTLYGKAAGVGIQATAAGPMGGMKINIRGAQGLESTSGTRPLFVVDGVLIYDTESSMASRDYNPLNSFDFGSAVNDINVEDIESMEILKGAKASVLYGSAGANGVVLITTKSGSGKRGLGVQLSYGQEVFSPITYIDFQNEFGSGQNEYSYDWKDEAETIRRTVSDRQNFGPAFDGSSIKFFDGTVRSYLPYENNYLDMFNNGSSRNMQAAIQGEMRRVICDWLIRIINMTE